MVIIHNDINQPIVFVDDRGKAERSNPISMGFRHVASEKESIFTAQLIDASNLRNGIYQVEVMDTITTQKITSFMLKVIDVKSLSLTENNNSKNIGYKNN